MKTKIQLSQRGFTLIELLAVMAIIGVLAAIVVPAVSGTGETSRGTQSQQDAYLSDLPLTIELDDFTIVHGSPRDPLWEYVKTPEAAVAAFESFGTTRCLVGHSHIGFICRPQGDTAVFSDFPLDDPTQLGTERLMINPGAVGQPRDRDPRASYAIYDSDQGTICRRRVEYDVAATQQKMRDRGLPRYLVERLAHGL